MASEVMADRFRRYIKAVGPLSNDAEFALDVAESWVMDRVYPDPDSDPLLRRPEVTQAILLLANRMLMRRQSPEGVAGWGDLGVVRVVADPDIRSMIELHVDHTKVGIA